MVMERPFMTYIQHIVKPKLAAPFLFLFPYANFASLWVKPLINHVGDL